MSNISNYYTRAVSYLSSLIPPPKAQTPFEEMQQVIEQRYNLVSMQYEKINRAKQISNTIRSKKKKK